MILSPALRLVRGVCRSGLRRTDLGLKGARRLRGLPYGRVVLHQLTDRPRSQTGDLLGQLSAAHVRKALLFGPGRLSGRHITGPVEEAHLPARPLQLAFGGATSQQGHDLLRGKVPHPRGAEVPLGPSVEAARLQAPVIDARRMAMTRQVLVLDLRPPLARGR